jgi:hypothetical protein
MSDDTHDWPSATQIGYQGAEQDIAEWLDTQVPVPVCRELARRIRAGAHREFARQRSQWEIPIELHREEPDSIDLTKRFVARLGAQVCRNDDGALVVVPLRPMTAPAIDELAKQLRTAGRTEIRNVGVPVEFPPTSGQSFPR